MYSKKSIIFNSIEIIFEKINAIEFYFFSQKNFGNLILKIYNFKNNLLYTHTKDTHFV